MNREQWLASAVEALDEKFFAPNDLEFEHPVKISVGWCRGSNKAIGQCWSHEASDGKFVEIFISPKLSDVVEVLATTLHEMIHAHLGNGKGHGKEFKRIKDMFGLAGRVTATFAEVGSELYTSLAEVGKGLGEYPHKALVPSSKPKSPDEEGSKGGWPRFKSKSAESYRVMVSPKLIEEFGIPLDPWGEPLIPTKGE